MSQIDFSKFKCHKIYGFGYDIYTCVQCKEEIRVELLWKSVTRPGQLDKLLNHKCKED